MEVTTDCPASTVAQIATLRINHLTPKSDQIQPHQRYYITQYEELGFS